MYTYSLFDDIFNLNNMVNDFFAGTGVMRKREYPYVALYQKGDELEINALVPGVDADSLDVNLVDGTLVIEGEKKSDYADTPYIRKERQFGSFKKAVKLPYRVDADKIDASLVNGILRIKLTKSEEAKPKKIAIN